MTSQLARTFAVDVAQYVSGLAPTDPSLVWVRFKGINDLDPNFSPTLVSTDDYDSNGWTGQEKTMMSGVLTLKARRPIDGGVYDPGQELVRRTQIQFGDSARVFSRYYDRFGGVEARAGVFIPDWSQSKTGVADLAEVTAKLTSDGAVIDIQNPYAPTAAPVIVAVSPAGRGTGQIVTITGSGFTGAVATTGVKFGGTNATDFRVLSDSAISAVLPTGSAGTTPVLVTNATGSSAAFTYTRAA